MRLLRREPDRPDWASDPSQERVLAAACADGGTRWLLGTGRHLAVVPDPASDGLAPELWSWDQVRTARWETESATLLLEEVGSWGEHRRSAAYVVDDGEPLVRLVRDRVTASVVLRRRVAVRARQGFEVVARRNPAGGPVQWQVEFDEGIEPSDDAVAALADEALAAARDEVGAEPEPPI